MSTDTFCVIMAALLLLRVSLHGQEIEGSILDTLKSIDSKLDRILSPKYDKNSSEEDSK